jgi:hypothetical protein
MSSGHYIIVARNDITGKIELPLDDLTLYGQGIDPETKAYIDDDLVMQVARGYDEDWTISLYGRVGMTYGGTKKKAEI